MLPVQYNTIIKSISGIFRKTRIHDYKTIKYDEYLNRLKNLQKEKELEKKEQEIKEN